MLSVIRNVNCLYLYGRFLMEIAVYSYCPSKLTLKLSKHLYCRTFVDSNKWVHNRCISFVFPGAKLRPFFRITKRLYRKKKSTKKANQD